MNPKVETIVGLLALGVTGVSASVVLLACLSLSGCLGGPAHVTHEYTMDDGTRVLETPEGFATIEPSRRIIANPYP